MSESVSRRRFLVSAGAVLGVGPVLAACGGGGGGATAASCEGYAALDGAALQQRQSLGYMDASPNAAQRCDNCRFYNAPAEGAACGGCQLFPGPVVPGGWCRSWVAQAV